MSANTMENALLLDEAFREIERLGLVFSGVTEDSRSVDAGKLFIATPGGVSDGRRYIGDAISRGALAVFWESQDGFEWDPTWTVPNFGIPKLHEACGFIAHRVLGFPTERLHLIAVTGTNGKTSIAYWAAASYPRSCALIGTLGAKFKEGFQDAALTTPTATALASYLDGFAKEGANTCVIEASSVGIDEGRLNGVRIDTAVFTNLTRDHLDYHGSMDAYGRAKEKLFTWPKLRLAIINVGDPFGRLLAERTTASRVLCYSAGEGIAGRLGIIQIEDLQEGLMGMSFRLCMPQGRAMVDTALLGRHNVENLLAVAALLSDTGLSVKEIAHRLSVLTPPPGRLEKIGGYNEPMIVVDYAHTPDALQHALMALSPTVKARGGRLTLIFGCGGNRDQGKRPEMGEIAMKYADRVFITSDNPRDEEPLAIIEDIRKGAPHAEVILDRAEAIVQAVCQAGHADVILLAGKGHEPYQEIKGVKRPFSDLEEARAALLIRKEPKSCQQ